MQSGEQHSDLPAFMELRFSLILNHQGCVPLCEHGQLQNSCLGRHLGGQLVKAFVLQMKTDAEKMSGLFNQLVSCRGGHTGTLVPSLLSCPLQGPSVSSRGEQRRGILRSDKDTVSCRGRWGGEWCKTLSPSCPWPLSLCSGRAFFS